MCNIRWQSRFPIMLLRRAPFSRLPASRQPSCAICHFDCAMPWRMFMAVIIVCTRLYRIRYTHITTSHDKRSITHVGYDFEWESQLVIAFCRCISVMLPGWLAARSNGFCALCDARVISDRMKWPQYRPVGCLFCHCQYSGLAWLVERRRSKPTEYSISTNENGNKLNFEEKKSPRHAHRPFQCNFSCIYWIELISIFPLWEREKAREKREKEREIKMDSPSNDCCSARDFCSSYAIFRRRIM